MILDPKKTTIAYRCPSCGAGIMSVVGLFNLTADMLKLKCDCGQSAMTINYTKDSKVRLSVPCVLCPNPHHFTVSTSVFFKDELFILPCPYSDLTVAVSGEENKVKAELARSELELIDLLEKSGLESFDQLKNDESGKEMNPEITEILTYVIRELDEEGKIECDCPSDTEGEYEIEFLADSLRISCKCCKAEKKINVGSLMQAHALLEADKLTLKSKT